MPNNMLVAPLSSTPRQESLERVIDALNEGDGSVMCLTLENITVGDAMVITDCIKLIHNAKRNANRRLAALQAF